MAWQSVPVTSELLNEIVRRIVKVVDPQKIVMFGSRARGEERGDSDLDLLVIATSNQPAWERSVPLRRVLWDIPVSIDILVRTPDEVEDWREVRMAFVTTAMREGKVLYERPN